MLLLICALCLVIQVLVRPAVGIANNGDFPKMAGPLSLGPEDGDWLTHKHYAEFVYRYLKADRYSYNENFREAEFLSSEFFFVKLARRMQRIFHPGPRFDIRWLGGVTGVFYLLAVAFWIYAIPARRRLYAGAMVIVIWTDVAYVQYLNSFYMDTASMIFLLLAVGAALHAVAPKSHWVFPVLTVLAAALFAGSKSQHAPASLLFIPFFLSLAYWTGDRLARGTWIAGSLLVVLAVSTVLGRDTVQWRSTNLYNQVFGVLTPASPDPLRTLRDLGLGKNELKYVGSSAFPPTSGMWNPDWVREFSRRCTYATLLRYYVLHPRIAAHLLYQELSTDAPGVLPYANRSPDDGFPPDTKATGFSWWSDFRSFLFTHAPWHIILLMFGMVAGGGWLLWRSPAQRPFAALVLMVQALAAAEYAIAIFADGVETKRHLFLFHVVTEISILLLPIAVWKVVMLARSEHATVSQPTPASAGALRAAANH